MGEGGCLNYQRCTNRNKRESEQLGEQHAQSAHKKNHSSQTNVINEQRLVTECSRNLFSEHITANIRGRPL